MDDRVLDVAFTATSPRSRVLALAAFALLTAALAPLAAQQSVKVNDPLTRGLFGEIERVQTSPDGGRAVFFATMDAERQPLFSVPTKGGTPVVLTEDLPYYPGFRISPDSRFVHYLYQGLHVVPIDGERAPALLVADAVRFEYAPDGSQLYFSRANGIFALPLEGGVPVLVSPLPATATGTSELSVSGDGRWIVFRASAEGHDQLYSAAVGGSTGPLRLNGDLVRDRGVDLHAIAPGGLRVVYRADEDTTDVEELFSVPIDGSAAPVKLTGPLTRLRALAEWTFSRDGSRVLYRADQDTDTVYELYSAPIAGGQPPVKLNGLLPPGGDVEQFAPAEGGIVVFLADQSTDNVSELFQVGDLGGSAPVRSSQLAPGTEVSYFQMTANGRRVVYGVTGLADLFSVSIRTPGDPVQLTQLASGEYISPSSLSPDSTRVAYTQRGSGEQGVFSVPIDGGSRARLDDGGFVLSSLLFTSDGERVLYLSDRDAAQVYELFSAASDGSGAPVKLNRPLDGGLVIGDVSQFQFGELGTRGTYVVKLYTGTDTDVDELHGVQLEPRAKPVLLATGDVGTTLITPDEQWVAYTIVSPGGEGSPWLYGVPLDGSSAPQQLNDSSHVSFGVDGVRLAPDGRTVFYSQDGQNTGIYRVPVDGSAPHEELTGWGLNRYSALRYELSTDGGTLVVLADALVEHEYELFSLPSDGSAPPVRLNDVSTPRGTRLYTFRITPDGERVIYATDQETDEIVELFSVPIDGSAPPMKLSGVLAPGTDVRGFAFAPGSSRIVFSTDAPGFMVELWSALLDASAPPVRLNPPLPAGGDVTTFRVVPGSAQVVFLADQAADERYELFVVPIDGSAPARRINGTLPAGGDVTSFEIDPGGTRVVYRADQVQDEVFELFSASMDGASTTLQITGPHVAGGDVGSFRIAPDGQRVVFNADHDVDEVVELYVAPIDRIKEARKLNGSLVAGGDVRSGFEVHSSGRVVYIADQDEDTVAEAYLTSLTFPRARPSGAIPRASR